MGSWVVSAAALLLAIVALAMVRRLAHQFSTLTRSYWELRYDYTRLRSRLSRLDPDEGALADPAEASGHEPAGAPATGATVSYVPLSTIRKKPK